MGDENIHYKLSEKNGMIHIVDSIMQPFHNPMAQMGKELWQMVHRHFGYSTMSLSVSVLV